MSEEIQNFATIRQVLTEILGEICSLSDCQSVGIRIEKNGDYPYFVHKGFPEFFILKENSLCTLDDEDTPILDEDGNPLLECMCGNVIKGRFDPKFSFFTEKGSFWTNNTTQYLESTTDKERLTRTRNMCNNSGYESVALIPMRSGNKTLGLIQLNDPRKNMFTQKDIENYEVIANQLGSVVLNTVEIQQKMNEVLEIIHKHKSK